VSSGIDLRVSRSLELLASLRQTVADFAKREEQLTRDILTRRAATQRKLRDGIEKTEARMTAQLDESEEQFQTEETRIRDIHEKRRARIQRLHTTGIRDLPKRAKEAKGKWMGDLQMRHFRAERAMTAGQDAAGAELAAFTGSLKEQEEKREKLERAARQAFGGYWTLQALLRAKRAPTEADGTDAQKLFRDLRAHLARAEEQVRAYQRLLIPAFFAYVPLAVLLPVIVVGAIGLAWALGLTPHALIIAGATAAALLTLVSVLFAVGLAQGKAIGVEIAARLVEAKRLDGVCAKIAADRNGAERDRFKAEYDGVAAGIAEQWNRAEDIEAEFEKAAREKIERQVPRAFERNAKLLLPRISVNAEDRAARKDRIETDAEARKRQFTEAHETEIAEISAQEKARWAEIEADWQREIVPLYRTMEAMNAEVSAHFPAWSTQFVENWTAPATFTAATKFGHLDTDLAALAPKDSRLALPGSPRVSLPLSLTYPDHGSLLFETQESGGATVIGTLDNIILRLLTTTPPGKLSFTIIDPVGLGQNFAGLMHLGDYEEALINRKIWTQRDHIEERLTEMSEHIEKVIQMYLRNEYATITQYNEQAGSVAEKYHFIVVADFPASFGETAAKRLQSIAVSGPRCGIFTLIHWDQRQPLPDGFGADELRKNSICLRRENGEWVVEKAAAHAGAALVFDLPPDADLSVALVHKIGKASIDSNRVQVPFLQIAPKPEELWTNDTTNELKIAVGRTGATKFQYLAIGKGTRQHALFAGKTGSGKSTLFHVIITNLSLACSPEQVEFYLIDFKKGVEFKCYATHRLPHARVIAIESDREFALSVLQRVDAELKRRGDMFRKLGVQDVAGYKRAGGTEPMPRSLLLIDEFQEFFVEDDTIAQTASLLFDRIVRQGRAFGIHVLLGSQSLGGAYSLARATLGQMVIRVALQCNEADAYLIMDESNSAPRLLSRPGEGIYNDAGGALEGNSPFQVVWLSDEERDEWLDKVHDLAERKQARYPSPIVFEGNAPADLRENDLLRDALENPPTKAPHAARCWLGAPNSIKGPTEVVFHRQSGNHLLVVGQREEASLTLLGVSLISLAAQYPVGGAKFVLLHSANPGTPDADFIERVLAAIPHETTVGRGQEITDAMNMLAAEQKARSADHEYASTAAPIFVFIHGLHRFKKLRHEDDFSFGGGDETASPGAQLNDIITEGSGLGIHLFVTVDTYNNINRSMSRKALSEFEMRVIFQMSQNDSASLIDSPKASGLGLHRALFYNEHEGTLETFRPYALPDAEWIRHAAEKLARVPA
jgi:ABC-type multidrug transport system fused ATPase/permease subunit